MLAKKKRWQTFLPATGASSSLDDSSSDEDSSFLAGAFLAGVFLAGAAAAGFAAVEKIQPAVKIASLFKPYAIFQRSLQHEEFYYSYFLQAAKLQANMFII